MAFCIKASVLTHVTTIMFLVSLFKRLNHSIRQHALSGRCSPLLEQVQPLLEQVQPLLEQVQPAQPAPPVPLEPKPVSSHHMSSVSANFSRLYKESNIEK